VGQTHVDELPTVVRPCKAIFEIDVDAVMVHSSGKKDR
jgi:hypothetical protein